MHVFVVEWIIVLVVFYADDADVQIVVDDRLDYFVFGSLDVYFQYIDAFMAGPNPIEVSLNLHSTQTRRTGDTFFYKHDYPSVSKRFEDIQQRYIDCFDRATPLFDNLTPRSSQLHECR